jgi:hypothetical protein
VCRTQCQSHVSFFSEFSCNGVHGLDSVLVLRAQTRGFADVPILKEAVGEMRMCCARPDKYVYIYRGTKGLQGPRRERERRRNLSLCYALWWTVTGPDRRYLLVLLAHIEPSATSRRQRWRDRVWGAAGHNVTSCQCTVVESTASTAGPGALPEASRYLLWPSSSAMRSTRREASPTRDMHLRIATAQATGGS